MTIEEHIKYAEQKQDEAFNNNSLQSLAYWDGYKTAMEHVLDKGYRKASEVAMEIFDEIEAHFDTRIAFYQDMRFRAYSVGKDDEVKYANTMITNLTIYKEEIAELKKKYTEDEG